MGNTTSCFLQCGAIKTNHGSKYANRDADWHGIGIDSSSGVMDLTRTGGVPLVGIGNSPFGRMTAHP
jgi:hypothetical protein